MTQLTQPASASRIKIPAIEDYLHELTAENPVGPSLRYDFVYDEIRTSRLEDDPRLSMGIWKTELKRADWGKIEKLCTEALLHKSKDLQIAAWLAEAWIILDGCEGYLRGIDLLSGLCQEFWPSIHPQPAEGQEMESRNLIFEWIDSTVSSRLLNLPLTHSTTDQASLGLGFLKSAQHADAAQKRSDKAGKTPVMKNDPKNGESLEEFQKSLSQTSWDYLSTQHENMFKAITVTENFKELLTTLWGNEAPAFSTLLKTLKEMDRVVAMELQKRPPPAPAVTLPAEKKDIPSPPAAVEGTSIPPVPASPLPPTPPVPLDGEGNMADFTEKRIIRTRHEAYRQLDLIAAFLEENDPHSPAHQLIRQLIRWENHNILDIFGEIAQSPQDLAILMRLLGSSAEKG